MKNYILAIKTFIVCVLCINISASSGWANSLISRLSTAKIANESTITEGPVSKVVFTVGPFDIHRRYLSMEGPWVRDDFKVGDMIASKNIELPESMVHYLENGGATAGMISMNTSSKPVMQPVAEGAQPIGLIHLPRGRRELYWFKGVKLEVLDENGVVQPTAEFICHWNLDVDPDFRNKIFTEGHNTPNPRLSSISQAETLQILPQGFGVPVASDEPLTLSFQAANRTTDVHRRIRHRCTLYFIKDQDLYYPIKALYWYVPYMTVVADKDTPKLSAIQKQSCPMCVGASEGVDAPNDKIGGTFRDPTGRVLSPHWVIPPGEHTYRDVVGGWRDRNFQKGNPIVRAAWTHVHPLCSKLSLVECSQDKRIPVLSTTCKTKTTPGLQITKLDFLTPKGGVQIHELSQYELEVTYHNTLPIAVDSMASMGIYMEDPGFARPKWALHDYKTERDFSSGAANQNGATLMSCAVPGACNKLTSENDAAHFIADDESLPLSTLDKPFFNPEKDGPLLTEAKTIVLNTNAGPLTLRIDPTLAPMTATHIYRLLSTGTYNGTRVFQYKPNEFLQFANAEDKAPGQRPVSKQSSGLLRRLPLEVTKQKYNQLNHHQYVLSMSRFDNVPDSATSSFCIVLKDAAHMDHRYAILGKLEEDAATLESLTKIENNWNSNKFWIIDSKVNQLAAN